MAESCSMESLDYWRKFFSCADADIFQVIKHAILVAWADFPVEFLAWRDQITEIVYTCWKLQCSASGVGAELKTPEGGGVVDYGTSEGTPKESKSSSSSEDDDNEHEPAISNELCASNRTECSNLDEFEALTDEIEEQQQTVGEVLRIKGVLTNWKEESENVLSESLRRLQLMELSVETLSATDIGRAVSALNKHKSKPIRQLSKTLITGWKLLADEWVNAAAATQEASPASVNPSPFEEDHYLPSELDFPPLDVGALLATQTAPFEFSKFFDGIDEDGNPTCMKDSKDNGRASRQSGNYSVTNNNSSSNSVLRQNENSNLVRKDSGDSKRREVVTRAQKPVDATHRALKTQGSPSCSVSDRQKQSNPELTQRKPQQNQTNSEELRGQLAVRRAPKPQDGTLKASKPQDVPSSALSGRPPVRAAAQRNTQQRLKASGAPTKPCLEKDVPKESEESSYRRKLEVAKRKLQDRYEEAKNAKKQRTIQVMELKDLPKQCQSQEHLKGRHGNYFKRNVNMKYK